MIKLNVDGSGLVNKIKRALESVVDTEGTLAANRLMSALISNTPIKTGYARSRWTLQEVSTYTVKYEAQYKQGAFFREFKISLSNDAPYIIYLNQGSSKQAPAYFIEATILSQGFRINTAVAN